MAVKLRPSGITELTILEIVNALAYFGLVALISILTTTAALIALAGPYEGVSASLRVLLQAILAVAGVICLVLAYGLWMEKDWGLNLAFKFAVIGIVISIFTLPSGVITLVINGLIIYYLREPHVRAFFGRAPLRR